MPRLVRLLAAFMLAASVAAGSGAGPLAAQPSVRAHARVVTPAKKHKPRKRAKHAPRAVAATPKWMSPRDATALATDLGGMLTAKVRGGSWGVVVVSLSRGDTLYSLNADTELQPASNMKLYTSALALDQFGAQYQFSTDILRDGSVSADGTLNGNIILRGDGDPGLSRRFIDGGPGAAMDALAQLVADAAIKRVRGSLVADASGFDARTIPDGWQKRYLGLSYAARVSALSMNENLLWIVVHPGATSKQSATVTLEPAADLPIINNVRTLAASRGARITAHTTAGGTVEVGGWIGAKSADQRYSVVVEDPAALCAATFRKALQARGITVDLGTRFAATPPTAVKIASLPSPPLARLLSVMNRESVNHFAELLFRDAGRTTAKTQVGSAETGNNLLQQFMTTKVGAAPGAVFAADGSGLSVLDRVTPRSLVQLLSYAHRAPWGDAFHASLPVAGESELLRRRMKFTPAQGNLHAKTGTTNSVISLGGYVTAQDGELLAFAFIYNGHDRWNAKSAIDQMGATLASFARE
ncbi:MAG: D-alanyl-D-alanine carboxypeptidase/D-alanyl-D-alanine-endopeptidase [Gemmatimonadaceae bacterium]